ncbi:MAG: RagB/SusD family nutrient uptake outer membrane protein [Bacteroidales bacterium]|nr:RagB/SusD family nutrient uptake outer membrane protein [Bacteroidales bacterium]
MKNNKIFAGLIATALLAPACNEDFLEVQKPDGEPLEEYYTTDERLNEALNAAYDPLQWPDWDGVAYNALTCDAEIMGEDFWVGGSNAVDNEHWHKLFNFEGSGVQTLQTLWGDFYSGIKRCNDAIKYVSWNTSVSKDKLVSYEMQARLLRVYYYNIMWHYYGNIPFYIDNLSVPYTAPQQSADEIYAQLIDELENKIIASKALPMKWGASDCGRVSQAMAYMLYAEMVMYQNDKDRFATALNYMNEIINSGEYSLNPDYANLWEEDGEWCSESIFEINYNDDNAQRDWGDAAKNCGGTVLPTLISPNGFPGGTELHPDPWDSGADGWGFLPMRVQTYDMFAEGDVRREATCWDLRYMPYQNGVDKNGNPVIVDYNPRYQDTHIWLNKYRPKTENFKDCPTSGNLNYNNNLRVYRYAETLLNAAELIARGAGSGDAKALLYQVRKRAGLEAVDATLDNIIKERHYEFVGEGKRYFDLVRLVDVPESSVNAKNTLVPNEYRTNTWTDSKKHIPLGQSELDKDPSLVQNNY